MANLSIKALHLYTAPLSGCSARIRIAANLKSIPLTHHTLDLAKFHQTSVSYTSINPNASVPSLVVETTPDERTPSSQFIITQSPAIIDFLESHWPDPALIPNVKDFQKRARVFELASLVACDIQPPQNSRIRKKIVTEFGGDGEAWARYVYERGFGVYEKVVERARLDGQEGRYSVGDEITLADVFLVPAIQGGLRVGIELDKWPLTKSIVDECWKLKSFRQGGVGGKGSLIP